MKAMRVDGLSQRAIAEQVGCSAMTVNRCLATLDLVTNGYKGSWAEAMRESRAQGGPPPAR